MKYVMLSILSLMLATGAMARAVELDSLSELEGGGGECKCPEGYTPTPSNGTMFCQANMHNASDKECSK